MNLWLLVVALGCRAPDADPDEEDTSSATTDTTDTEAPPHDSGEYLADDMSEPPEVDLEALGVELSGIFGELWTYNSVEVFELYDELLLRHQDPSCPELVERETGSYWNRSCTTASGATFDGYLSRTFTGTGENITASGAVINTPEGSLNMSGDYSYTRQTSEGTGSWRYRIDAVTTWDGEWREDSWLEQGRDSRLSMEGSKSPTGTVQTLIDGRLLGLDGAVEALVFNGGSVIHENGGCPDEPSGELTVLVDGRWVDLFFDGPTELLDEVDPKACDGCATAWALGYYLGEVCVDLSELKAWIATDEPPF